MEVAFDKSMAFSMSRKMATVPFCVCLVRSWMRVAAASIMPDFFLKPKVCLCNGCATWVSLFKIMTSIILDIQDSREIGRKEVSLGLGIGTIAATFHVWGSSPMA